nr:MAG TPA: hypothetical protein [Caudoviricetes sp.]
MHRQMCIRIPAPVKREITSQTPHINPFCIEI